MKTMLMFTLYMVAALNCLAQNYKVNFTKEVSASSEQQIIKTKNGYLGSEQTDNKMQFAGTARLFKVRFGIKLTMYDDQMNKVKELALHNGERAYGPFNFQISYYQDKLYVFYFQVEGEEEGSISIFASEINVDDLSVQPAIKLLTFDQKNAGLFGGLNVMDNHILSLGLSPDGKKLIMFWTPNNNDKCVYYYKVFNPDFSTANEKTGIITNLERSRLIAACTDNNGTVYIAYKGLIDKNIETHLIVCPASKKETETALHLEDYSLLGVSLLPSKKGGVHIGGGFNYPTDLITRGFFHAIINPDGKISKPESYQLTDDLLSQFDKDGFARMKKNASGLEGAIYLAPYEMEDSSYVLSNAMKSRFSNIQMRTTIITTGSILHIRFANGTATGSRIPKWHKSVTYTAGDGYYAMPFHNTMLYFYNDEESNLKKPVANEAGVSSFSKAVLVAASVDKNGTVTREKITGKDGNFTAVADYSQTLPGIINTFYLPMWELAGSGAMRDKVKFATIKVK